MVRTKVLLLLITLFASFASNAISIDLYEEVSPGTYYLVQGDVNPIGEYPFYTEENLSWGRATSMSKYSFSPGAELAESHVTKHLYNAQGGYTFSLVHISYTVNVLPIGGENLGELDVPLNVNWSVKASAAAVGGASSLAQAWVSIFSNTSGENIFQDITARSDAYHAGENQFASGHDSISVKSGHSAGVHLLSFAEIKGELPLDPKEFLSGEAYAFADPVFTIDESFAYADLFKLEFSGAGIHDAIYSEGFQTPVVTVPEPATAWLLISGLLCFAGRRVAKRY